ncbi:MAG TPA: hypothetical protein VKM94_26025 [Blastocatellia bacterium]|nr:hypothetical protein [Blastocatellia bacterium]
MRIFGKNLSDYIAVQKGMLLLIALVALGRLALSLAGVSNSAAKWLSVTAVMALGAVYAGIKVNSSGFGGFRHLLPMVFFQDVLAQLVVAGGIALAIVTQKDNIFSAPEYSGNRDGKTWSHSVAHLVLGFIVAPLVSWGISSLVLLLARKTSPGKRDAEAASA